MTASSETRSRVLLWLRRGGLLILAVLVIEYLVLPQMIGARQDISLLSSAATGC